MWVWLKKTARVNNELIHFTGVRKEIRKDSTGVEVFLHFLYNSVLLLYYFDIILHIMKQLKDVLNKEGNNAIDVF